MTGSRALYLVELASISALTAGAMQRQTGFLLGDPWLLLVFAGGYFIVELMEVELPRGDVSTMASPLIAAGVMSLPLGAAVLAVLPTGLLAQLATATGPARRSFDYHDFARRVVVLLSGLLAYSAVTERGVSVPGVFVALWVGAVVVLTDYLLAQVKTAVLSGTPFWRQVLGGSSLQGWMLAAKIVTAALAVVVLPEMAGWGVFVVALLLIVMRQAFASYVSVRRAYQSTMEALARTVEAQDPARTGHAQRVSDLATEVGRQMHMRGASLERLAYAALLHDLGDVGQERVDRASSDEAAFTAADMVSDIGFLSDVVPVLQLCDGSHELRSPRAEDLTIAYVVLVASRTDDFARGHEVEGDSMRLRALTPILSPQELERVERAFRHAATRVEGTLFAYDRPGGQE